MSARSITTGAAPVPSVATMPGAATTTNGMPMAVSSRATTFDVCVSFQLSCGGGDKKNGERAGDDEMRRRGQALVHATRQRCSSVMIPHTCPPRTHLWYDVQLAANASNVIRHTSRLGRDGCVAGVHSGGCGGGGGGGGIPVSADDNDTERCSDAREAKDTHGQTRDGGASHGARVKPHTTKDAMQRRVRVFSAARQVAVQDARTREPYPVSFLCVTYAFTLHRRIVAKSSSSLSHRSQLASRALPRP